MKLIDYLKTTDATSTIYYNQSVGRTLSRAEIEDAITSGGHSIPTRDVLFYIVDNTDKAFLVRYFKDIDAYGFEKLTMR
jgi:hypothetical protein